MTQKELDKIVEQHQHWLKEDCKGWEGMRANLAHAYLAGANLTGANLMRAYLAHADLAHADLTGADLAHADLAGANLAHAYLADANLTHADLARSDLAHADLTGADLTDANLTHADLARSYLADADKFRLGKVLDEPLTGYKKTKEGVVITAEIPAGAIVFCINGSKCRTNKAKITDMDGREVLHSQYDNSFEYRLGQEINIKDFNLMYNVECASGFHFFRTRKEAKEYN